MSAIRWRWALTLRVCAGASILVKIGAVFGLGTVMLVMLLGQSRVFYSMSRDGLLWKWAGKIHPKFRTPWISNLVVGAIVAFMPALLPIGKLSELVNMGTLLAFAIVCAGVWILRRRNPDLHRPFKTPYGSPGSDPWYLERFVPDLDAAGDNEDCGGWLAGVWVADLLHLQREAQQGAEGASGGSSRMSPLLLLCGKASGLMELQVLVAVKVFIINGLRPKYSI